MFDIGHWPSAIFKNSSKKSLSTFPGSLRLWHAARPSLALMAGLSLALLSGCMMGPDFQRPQVTVPADWAASTAESSRLASASDDNKLADWWTVFQDPILTSLVERAAASNLDLKLAEARIRQARAAKSVAAGGLGPTLDASGAYQRNRSSAGNRTGAATDNQYQAGFDAG
uniref:TolC family protein n=1 Tax=Candidatus Desulfatibia profunda TaxID=2841695 RepID=A0A8J6NXE9_9BACT|nr:TolC family protein [Candidatus Desulfatibia profunda]